MEDYVKTTKSKIKYHRKYQNKELHQSLKLLLIIINFNHNIFIL